MSPMIKRTDFPSISVKAWQHPADRAALAALKKVPGLDLVLSRVIGSTTERSLRLMHLSSAVRVNENQFARVYRLHREACAIFNIEDRMPELFVAQTPMLNAHAVGVDNPFIVLNSSTLDALDDEELLAIIGHEVGHCISGHVLYKTLLSLLLRFTTIAASVPLAGLPLMAVISALREWDRKSELSADRAGLLAVQNPETSFHLLMKMAGGPRIEQMSTNEFFKQAAEYEAGGSLIDGLYKLLNLLGQTHPFAVIRLVELKTWVDDGSYGRILGGDYIREEEAGRRTVGEEFSEARKKYEEDIRSSEDPLVGLFRSVGDAATDAANAAGDKAKEIFDTVFGSEKKDR